MTAPRFHPEALEEYLAAAAWYGADAGGLFVEHVASATSAIAEAPHAWPRWSTEGDARRFVLGRFPYSLIYLPEPAALVIVAVAHHRRAPGYWRARIGQP